MNRPGPRGVFSSSASRSTATPSTRCQKCLQLGHYSFECKSSATERPYTSRPSRTQQLLNPRLRQKLTEDTLPEERLGPRKSGTADQILKEKEELREQEREREGRGRKRQRDSPSRSPDRSRVARSLSTGSSSSYSSISSGRSPTPPRRSLPAESLKKNHDRSVRRKYRDSPSPGERGRRLSPTDYSRRTRSISPRPKFRRSNTPRGPPQKRESPPPRKPNPPRKRSLSPFTQRRLRTEAMNRGG